MKILCFSINPIFPDKVSGGASKHLMNLLKHLAAKGHKLRVLCPELETLKQRYKILPNLEIWPVLPFHQPFPQPYAISPAELAWIAEEINRHLAWADHLYVHDGELLLPQLQSKLPTVLSFRDNYYPESILGSFINLADEIICVSPYSYDVILASAGRLLKGMKERMHTIRNGIDPAVYKPVPLEENLLVQKLPISLDNRRVLLHPHRPDPRKGLLEAVELTGRLAFEKGMKDLVLLAPRWDGAMAGEEESSFYKLVRNRIHDSGLSEHVVLLDWMSQDEMPSFYALGNLSLCLGNLPEAFGNVAYESLACGTPALVTRVGVHRRLLPDALINKVDYGDWDGALEMAARILDDGKRLPETDRQAVLSYFDLQQQLDGYESLIIKATKRDPLEAIYEPVCLEATWKLAPWVYLSARGLFHDQLGRLLTESELKGGEPVLDALKHSETIEGRLFEIEAVESLYRLGVIIPRI